MWYQSIIYIVTAIICGVKIRFHPQLNDLDNMLASVVPPQFKMSWLKDSVKIKVITERMIKLVNEKERLNANGNTERQESSCFFAALHRKSSSKDKVGKKQVDVFL